MPTYKFFEVAKSSENGAPKDPQFVPFNLSYNERSKSRKQKSDPEDAANEDVKKS